MVVADTIVIEIRRVVERRDYTRKDKRLQQGAVVREKEFRVHVQGSEFTVQGSGSRIQGCELSSRVSV